MKIYIVQGDAEEYDKILSATENPIDAVGSANTFIKFCKEHPEHNSEAEKENYLPLNEIWISVWEDGMYLYDSPIVTLNEVKEGEEKVFLYENDVIDIVH